MLSLHWPPYHSPVQGGSMAWVRCSLSLKNTAVIPPLSLASSMAMAKCITSQPLFLYNKIVVTLHGITCKECLALCLVHIEHLDLDSCVPFTCSAADSCCLNMSVNWDSLHIFQTSSSVPQPSKGWPATFPVASVCTRRKITPKFHILDSLLSGCLVHISSCFLEIFPTVF